MVAITSEPEVSRMRQVHAGNVQMSRHGNVLGNSHGRGLQICREVVVPDAEGGDKAPEACSDAMGGRWDD